MSWFLLFLAGLFEIIWAIGLKYTEGFTKFLPSVLTLAAMLLSFWLLSLAVKGLPISTSYAIWTSMGIFGTTLFGILILGESASPLKLLCIALIILGILGLTQTSDIP